MGQLGNNFSTKILAKCGYNSAWRDEPRGLIWRNKSLDMQGLNVLCTMLCYDLYRLSALIEGGFDNSKGAWEEAVVIPSYCAWSQFWKIKE